MSNFVIFFSFSYSQQATKDQDGENELEEIQSIPSSELSSEDELETVRCHMNAV